MTTKTKSQIVLDADQSAVVVSCEHAEERDHIGLPRTTSRRVAAAKTALAKAANVQTGADLAGQCEGEQIADLIDLALEVAKSSAHENVSDCNALRARAQRIVNEIKSRA